MIYEKDVMALESYKIRTPEGTRDRLFAECVERRSVQGAMTSLFKQRGYHEVITPEVEYFDLFVRAKNPLPQKSMLKFVDREGRLLVIRPDCTTPIARIAASRLRDAALPQRLYYNQTIVRVNDTDTGSDSDIAQCGIELIGAPGLKGDIEAVAMAVDTLRAAGAGHFYIELGHVDFFAGLVADLEIGKDSIKLLKSCIEAKNFTLYEEVIKSISGSDADCLRRLPYLFGGEEILDEAYNLTDNTKARAAVDYLRNIYFELKAAGRGEYLRFDLGLVQSIDYYSGLVFRGYVEGAGNIVLAGGRYDELIGDFGADKPATGFAVYVDSLVSCLPPVDMTMPDTHIYYEPGFLSTALQLLDSLPKGTAVLSHCTSMSEAESTAKNAGIKRLFIVSDSEISEVRLNAKS